jgi:hypothetical protein
MCFTPAKYVAHFFKQHTLQSTTKRKYELSRTQVIQTDGVVSAAVELGCSRCKADITTAVKMDELLQNNIFCECERTLSKLL